VECCALNDMARVVDTEGNRIGRHSMQQAHPGPKRARGSDGAI